VIVKKNHATFSNQSEVKPKPILTPSRTFSRPLRQPHVFASSFDWFTGLYVSFVIGYFSIDFINSVDLFSIGFTTLKLKPLY